MSKANSKYFGLRNAQTGAFFPQVYSIGGRFVGGLSADEICALIQRNGLKDASEEQFIDALSFIHELNHLQVFLSSTFGLSAHLHTQMLSSALAKSDTPVPRQMTTDNGHDHLEVVFNYIRASYYYVHELGAAVDQIYPKDDPSELYGDEFTVFGYPCTVLGLLRLQTGDLVDKITAGKSLGFISEYWATKSISETQERSCRINASSIFECLALCAELNAFNFREPETVASGDYDALFDGLDDQYSIVFEIYLNHFGFSSRGLTTQLPILLDICLMQDTYVEFGESPLTKPLSGRRYLTPADVMFDVFAAAREMDDLDFSIVQDGTPESLQEFFEHAQEYQDRICKHLGLRTTREQAKLAIKKIDLNVNEIQRRMRGHSDLAKAPQNPMQLATWLHRSNLEVRMHVDAVILLLIDPNFSSLRWDGLSEFIPRVDLKSKCLIEKSPNNLDLLTGAALVDLLASKSNVCPFQKGRPYFCRSRMQFDKFCSIDTGDNTVKICPFYLLASFTDDGDKIGAAQKNGAIIKQI